MYGTYRMLASEHEAELERLARPVRTFKTTPPIRKTSHPVLRRRAGTILSALTAFVR